MEPSRSLVMTHELREQFRSDVEGCIPDLLEADDFVRPSDYRDEIHDYAADKACDLFPNIEVTERHKLVDWVVDYYCDKEEGNTQEDFTFSISDLKTGGQEEL